MYICTWLYIYICTCICIYVHVYVYMYMYMYRCTCIYICIYVHVYVYMYMYTYMCIDVHLYVLTKICSLRWSMLTTFVWSCKNRQYWPIHQYIMLWWKMFTTPLPVKTVLLPVGANNYFLTDAFHILDDCTTDRWIEICRYNYHIRWQILLLCQV